MYRYHLIRYFTRFLMFFLRARMRVTGQENIPKGPYIAVVNHMSIADTPLLLVAMPPTRFRFFAGEKWEAHWFYGPVMSWLGAIYINRGAVDRRALRQAIAAINDGVVFGLAPEGTRSKRGQMNRARDGAAYLATRTGQVILPVGVVNTDVLFVNARRLQPTDLAVHIGRPFHLPELNKRARGAELSAYTHYIMVQIAALLPEKHRGFYADSPALQALLAGEDPWPHCLAAEGAQEAG